MKPLDVRKSLLKSVATGALPLTLWCRAITVFVLLAVMGRPAFAVTNYWIGGASGDFTNAANWSTNAVPTAADATFFTNNSAISVSVSAAATNSDSTINSLAGSLDMNIAAGASWLTTNKLTVGNTAGFSSTLSSTNGGSVLVGGSLVLGNIAKSTGTVNVTGGQLVTTNSGGIEVVSVGSSGVGSMTVSGGQWLANNGYAGVNSGSSGTLNLSGGTNLFSANLIASYSGGSTGSVFLTGGQLVTTNSSANAGAYAGRGGVGNITVLGGQWLANYGYVGALSGSSGTLNLNGGTNWFSIVLYVAQNGGSTGSVFLTDGQLVTTNTIASEIAYVGNSGIGNMTVSGGQWLANHAYVGALSGSSGTLNLNGGTNLFRGSLFIGYAAGATGAVNVTAGLLVATNSGGTSQLLVGRSGQGTFTMSGGTVIADQLLVTNGANSTFAASGGSLTVKAATIGSSFSLTNSTGTFSSNLTVNGAGSLSGTNGAFVLYGNFINQSTNRAQFDLSQSTVLFTNATSHMLSLTNSMAFDLGGGSSVAQFATNFEIGTLSIALSNQVTLTGVKSGATTNALYVGWLDLTAWTTNAAGLTNTLQAALTLNDISLYYDPNDTRNAYLQDTQFNLWGGGLLIPIPEPSTTGLILGGAFLSLLLLRRKDGRS